MDTFERMTLDEMARKLEAAGSAFQRPVPSHKRNEGVSVKRHNEDLSLLTYALARLTRELAALRGTA